MKNRSLLLVSLAIIAFLVFWLVGRSNNKVEVVEEVNEPENEEVELKKIKVVLLEDLADVNFVLDYGEENGIFRQNGLEIERITAQRNAHQVLMGREADVIIGNLASTLSIYFTDAEPRVLATPFKTFDSAFLSRFSKDEVSEIKKAAVGRFGSGGHYNVDVALTGLGFDVDEDIELVAISGDPSRLKALEDGEVDFIGLRSEKHLIESGNQGKFTIYYPEEITEGNSAAMEITTSKDALDEKPEELRLFVLSFHEAMRELAENPEKASSYLISKYGYDESTAERFVSRFQNAIKDFSFIPDPSKWDFMIEKVKSITEPPNPDKDINSLVYDEFAREAVARQGEK